MAVHVIGENTRSCVPGDFVRITGVYVPLMRTGFRKIISGLTTEVYISAHYIENVNSVSFSCGSLNVCSSKQPRIRQLLRASFIIYSQFYIEIEIADISLNLKTVLRFTVVY